MPRRKIYGARRQTKDYGRPLEKKPRKLEIVFGVYKRTKPHRDRNNQKLLRKVPLTVG